MGAAAGWTLALPPSADAAVRLHVTGQVQGVGFRPFVYRLAARYSLSGDVLNNREGVCIRLRGASEQLTEFVNALQSELPPLAQIEEFDSEALNPTELPASGFAIVESDVDGCANNVDIVPDVAVCPQCLEELFNPEDRRWRYPFINCTHCGPRYSLIRALPYDRVNTSMSVFELCQPCAQEYRDPLDRRFHAQPNACPQCGPQLVLEDANGQPRPGDAIAATLAALRAGLIVAIRGVGGFHLACDADNAATVARLRQLKNRGDKPFALMVANVESCADEIAFNATGLRAVQSPGAPIVLQPIKEAGRALADRLAPHLNWVGIMLPHTPLHWLLFHEAAGRPTGTDWMHEGQALRLVMTSANRRGEPLISGNDEAHQKLCGMADLFLTHNREIVNRADDSVVDGRRENGLPAVVIRRGRGLAPARIALDERFRQAPVTLAFGSYLKNTLCLLANGYAYLSAPVGDLDKADNCRLLESRAHALCEQVGVQPEQLVCDLHPDNHASRVAEQWAQARHIPLIRIAHHVAHLYAVVGEYPSIQSEVLAGRSLVGLALDGTGLGWDGRLRGGELIRIDPSVANGFLPLGALQPLALAGGDRAAHEPWRLALALGERLGQRTQVRERLQGLYPDIPTRALDTVERMLAMNINAPQTSSLGRLFDAVAALAGVGREQQFESQAPMRLEALVDPALLTVPADEVEIDASGNLNLDPLLTCLLKETDPVLIASRFHAGLIWALAQWVAHSTKAGDRVLLSGGCLLNGVLREGLCARLKELNLKPVLAQKAAAGDGGLSLGQALAAQSWAGKQNIIDNQLTAVG